MTLYTEEIAEQILKIESFGTPKFYRNQQFYIEITLGKNHSKNILFIDFWKFI